MEPKLPRACLMELIGTFGVVLFSAGLVCINQTTTPAEQHPTGSLTQHQPGIFGIALGQGLILAAMLALTVPFSGGYLNPAITLMLWVFNRLETPRAAWYVVTQFVAGILAALCLRYMFNPQLLRAAHFGAPHLNLLAYPELGYSGQLPGTAIELLLTFFLVFAIFGMVGNDPLRLGIVTGMMMTVCALFGFPLTGAALNPARWLGPTLLEFMETYRVQPIRSPWADTLIYLAGPIIGALLGGLFVFRVYQAKGSTPKTAG